MQQGAAYVGSLTWTEIDGAAGCTSHTTGLMEYNRCMSVSSTGNDKLITLIVTPTGVFAGTPDTLTVYRHNARGVSLLR